MSFVERYHQPVWRAFHIIADDFPALCFDDFLQTAMKAVNDSVGLEGLITTLLVFAAYLRLFFDRYKPYPCNAHRALALRKAGDALTTTFSRRQVSSALGTRNGPDTTDTRASPVGHSCWCIVTMPREK